MEDTQALTVAASQAATAYSFNDVERMAVAVAKSGLFGMKTPEQALALMLLAQAEGLHPFIAARDYHIIQGRPSLKADTMLARFLGAGGRVEWHDLDEKKASATFSHPTGGKVTITWTIEMARAAGMAGKDVWKAFPRAMLRARTVSEGVRTVYPGVSAGIYTPEEIQDGIPADASFATPAQTGANHLREQWAQEPEPVKVKAEVVVSLVDRLKQAATAHGFGTADVKAILFAKGHQVTISEKGLGSLPDGVFDTLLAEWIPAAAAEQSAPEPETEDVL